MDAAVSALGMLRKHFQRYEVASLRSHCPLKLAKTLLHLKYDPETHDVYLQCNALFASEYIDIAKCLLPRENRSLNSM